MKDLEMFVFPTGTAYVHAENVNKEYAYIFDTGAIRWTTAQDKIPGWILTRIEHDADATRINFRNKVFEGTEADQQRTLIHLCEDLPLSVLTQVLAEDTTEERLNHVVRYLQEDKQ